MRVRYLVLLPVLCLITVATGCWDKIEIDKRAFIYTLSIDTKAVQDKNPEDADIKTKSKIKAILTIPLPVKVAASSSQGKSSPSEKPYISLTLEGRDIPDIIKSFNTTQSRTAFLDHTRLLIFGENLLKDKEAFSEVIDYIQRDAHFNKLARVAFIKGGIDSILDAKPEIDVLPSTYIMEVLDKAKENSLFIVDNISEMMVGLSNEGKTVLPCIEIKKDRVEINSLALIKDFQLLGFMDGKYMKAYTAINNKLKYGEKLFKYMGVEIPYNILSSQRRITLINKEEPLEYKISLQMNGSINEFSFRNLSKPATIKSMQEALDKSFKLEFEEAANFFQKVINEDYIGIEEYTRKYNNRIYNKYKDDWQRVFKNAIITFDVNTRIEETGTLR